MVSPRQSPSCLFLIAMLAATTLARADDGDIIDYRTHVMQTLGEQAAAIDMILAHKASAADLNTQLQSLAMTAATALKTFSIRAPGGKAKPEVWSNWEDFSRRMTELATNTAALQKVAASGGMTAVAPKFQSAMMCKGCHDIYSQPLDSRQRAGDPDAVAYRQHIMNTLEEQSQALGMILSGGVPDDNAGTHLDTLALTASMGLQAFEPQVPGGRAKSDVWKNWTDFSKRMNELAAKTAELAKTARTRGREAGLAGVADALTCKGCHDLYREENK